MRIAFRDTAALAVSLALLLLAACGSVELDIPEFSGDESTSDVGVGVRSTTSGGSAGPGSTGPTSAVATPTVTPRSTSGSTSGSTPSSGATTPTSGTPSNPPTTPSSPPSSSTTTPSNPPSTPENNACGGTADLPHKPDEDACGACHSGVWVCKDGDADALTCQGEADIDTDPAFCGAECVECREDQICRGGTCACEDPEHILCPGGCQAPNICGGCVTIPGDPVQPCGECESLVCDGEAFFCVTPELGDPDFPSSCFPDHHSVGGTIKGLRTEGLILKLDDQLLEVAAHSTSFTFPDLLPENTTYAVEVERHPEDGTDCTVERGSGFVRESDVTNVRVVCTSPSLGESCTMQAHCIVHEWCPAANVPAANRRCSPARAGEVEGLRFVWIPGVPPPSTIQIGSPSGELGRQGNNEAQVSVSLTNSWFMMRTDVTLEQWTALSGGPRPFDFHDCDAPDCPATGMTWWSTLGFANALSEREGLDPCYDFSDLSCGGDWRTGNFNCFDEATPEILSWSGSVYDCEGYRLPTEAEWERAARAGTTTATWAGNLGGTTCSGSLPVLGPIARYQCNSASPPGSSEYVLQEVMTRDPNPWGLYDILGNVWNYVWDRYRLELTGGTDPEWDGPGDERTLRGAGYDAIASQVRAARRFTSPPSNFRGNTGFRLVRTVDPDPDPSCDPCVEP